MNRVNQYAVVLGASRKSDRYSYLALQRLIQSGYPVIPVNPAYPEIEGIPCAASLQDAEQATKGEGIDTLTLYVGPAHSASLVDEIVAARPRRVIFNPGTESPLLEKALDEAEIPWIQACTLVLLATGQYQKV